MSKIVIEKINNKTGTVIDAIAEIENEVSTSSVYISVPGFTILIDYEQLPLLFASLPKEALKKYVKQL